MKIRRGLIYIFVFLFFLFQGLPGTKISWNSVVSATTVTNSDIVNCAYSCIGKPYAHSQGPDSFDCSGLVCYVFGNYGISLPWGTWYIYSNRSAYGTVFENESAALPGDLVSWQGHIGIYVGDGNVLNSIPGSGVTVFKVTSFKDVDGNVNPHHYFIRVNGVTYSTNGNITPITPIPITTGWTNKIETVSGTNAKLGITYNAGSSKYFGYVGLYIDGKYACGYDPGYQGSSFSFSFDLNNDAGITLQSGKTYKYKFYVNTMSGDTFSDEYSFTVPGSSLPAGSGTWNDYGVMAQASSAVVSITYNAGSSKYFGYVGLYIDGQYACGFDPGYQGTSYKLRFDTSKDTNMTLEAGRTYKVKFYVNTMSGDIYSNEYSFTTPGDSYAPEGHIDDVSSPEGYLNIKGWAFDKDNSSDCLDIHVYCDGNYLCKGKARYVRDDVNSAKGITGCHGIDISFPTNMKGSHKIDVYALNINLSGKNSTAKGNTLIGSKTINVNGDTSSPVISDAKVISLDSLGYTVQCKVTDNVGISKVLFPTWTVLNKQDDLAKDWSNNYKFRGISKGDDIYEFHVDKSDHNDEIGDYITQIYAYDKYGNWSILELDDITIPSDDNSNGNTTENETDEELTDILLQSEIVDNKIKFTWNALDKYAYYGIVYALYEEELDVSESNNGYVVSELKANSNNITYECSTAIYKNQPDGVWFRVVMKNGNIVKYSNAIKITNWNGDNSDDNPSDNPNNSTNNQGETPSNNQNISDGGSTSGMESNDKAVLGNVDITSALGIYNGMKFVLSCDSNVNGFEIEYSTNADLSNSQTKAWKKSNVRNYYYRVNDLAGGVVYYYRIRAYKEDANNKEYSSWTSIGSIQTMVKDSVTTESYNNNDTINAPKIKIKSVKNNKKNSIIVKWKWNVKADGYQIAYSTKKSMTGAKKKNVGGYYESKTIKGLMKGKTYFVRIRSYVKDDYGDKVYGKWSNVKKVKIKK